MTLLFGMLVSVFFASLVFSVWIVRVLDKSGEEMHKRLESDGEKYIRHIGAFGESTFTRIN